MTSISKPIPITSLPPSFNFNNYLYSSSPPSFNISSLLSSFDPLINIPCNNNNYKANNSDNTKNNNYNNSGNANNNNNKDNNTPDNTNDLSNMPNNNENKDTNVGINDIKDKTDSSVSATTATSTTATISTTTATTASTATTPDTTTTTNSKPLELTQSYQPHGVLKGTRMGEHVRKKVCFADDKGGSLVHVKIFNDFVFPSRSISFPKRREKSYQILKQLKGSKSMTMFSLFEMCPTLVLEIQSMKLEEWEGKRKEPTFAYYPEFSQPNSNEFEMIRSLREAFVSLECASLNDDDGGGSFGGGFGGSGRSFGGGYGGGSYGNERYGGGEKEMVFKARVLVESSTSENEVFLRVTCDKWKSYEDLEVPIEFNYVSQVFKSFILSKKLNEISGGMENVGNKSVDWSEKVSLVGCFPETVEFAVCWKSDGQKRWDNNNCKNYKFCRFCK